jgi:hypothetical protein
VFVVRPCGKLFVLPNGAKPPLTVIVGNPESSTFWLATTTPESGLPSATKIVDASNPMSCTVMKVSFREKPRRNSFKNVGENMCDSLRTADRLTGVFALPLSAGRAPGVNVLPR